MCKKIGTHTTIHENDEYTKTGNGKKKDLLTHPIKDMLVQLISCSLLVAGSYSQGVWYHSVGISSFSLRTSNEYQSSSHFESYFGMIFTKSALVTVAD